MSPAHRLAALDVEENGQSNYRKIMKQVENPKMKTEEYLSSPHSVEGAKLIGRFLLCAVEDLKLLAVLYGAS